MNEVLSLIPGGKTALGSMLQSNFAKKEVQDFLGEVKTQYDTNPEFKSEIEKAGIEVPSETNSGAKDMALLDGLTDQEKARVLNAVQATPSSSVSRYAGANQGQAVGMKPASSPDSTKWLIALGVAALVAIVIFRGVVFRTLYFLACKLPVVGVALKAKFGEPKEILSGKMSENTRQSLIADIKELSDLLGISGYRENEARLARFLRLIRKLNPDDVQEVMDAAKDYKLIR